MAGLECCGLEFASNEALAQHRVNAHFERREIVASCCGVDFLTQEGLREHQDTAHGERGKRS